MQEAETRQWGLTQAAMSGGESLVPPGRTLYFCKLRAACSLPLPQTPAGRLTSQDVETSRERNAREARVRSLFTCAAQYICLSYALQQGKDIYRQVARSDLWGTPMLIVVVMLVVPLVRAWPRA